MVFCSDACCQLLTLWSSNTFIKDFGSNFGNMRSFPPVRSVGDIVTFIEYMWNNGSRQIKVCWKSSVKMLCLFWNISIVVIANNVETACFQKVYTVYLPVDSSTIRISDGPATSWHTFATLE